MEDNTKVTIGDHLNATETKYSNEVMEYFSEKSAKYQGSLDENDINTGTGLVGAPSCGDVLKLQIKVEGDKIVDAKFRTFGCASAIASSAYAVEMLSNLTIDEAMKIKDTDIAKDLSLPPVKYHCSVLVESAIKSAVDDLNKKQMSENKNGG